MAAASGTVLQVASNNGVGTQSLLPSNGSNAPAPVADLYHMGSTVLASQYAVKKHYVCKHHKNSVSDPELSSFISDLHRAYNLN